MKKEENGDDPQFKALGPLQLPDWIQALKLEDDLVISEKGSS